MSRQMNNKSGAKKPFCKVCQDAGKSEKEYTSHYVRSEPGPNGKVVCPTLLSLRCGYCDGLGHTPKFCPILANHKQAEEKAMKQAARREIQDKIEAPKPAAAKKQSNVFAALCDSDSEAEKKVSKKVSTQKPVAKPVAKPAAKPAAKPVDHYFDNYFQKKTDEYFQREHKPSNPKTNSKINYDEEFPSMQPTSVKAAAPAAKPQGQSQIKSILKQLCPELKIADKLPEAEKYYVPQAKIIHKKPEPEPAPEPARSSTILVSDFVETAGAAAYLPYNPNLKASEIDWAQQYSSDDDSDEDW